MRAWRLLGSIVVVTIAGFFAVPSAPAHACGGGMVTEADADVAVSAQRVFVSTRTAGTTDIVAQLDVTGSKSYGVLIPLPSQPTLDTTPIDSKELDALDRATQVHLSQSEETYDEPEDSGCSCGGDAAKDGGSFGGGAQNGLGNRGVSASEFVDIGPVSASVLQADTGAALVTWLTENNFSVAADDQSVIDSYVGAGKYFIVVKRADGAPAGRSSIGLHFTLQGDQRGYPLRMAQVGAANELALSVYVSNEFPSAPTAPFQTLTLNDLAIAPAVEDSEGELEQNYTEAIRAAVSQRQGKAFVIEGVHASDEALASSPSLRALTDPGHRLSRLTTIVDSSTLDTDVAFTAPAPENVPTTREIGSGASSPQGTKQAFFIFGLLLPALLGLTARRMRKF